MIIVPRRIGRNVREIVIIIIGVLIALFAQYLFSEWMDRNRLREIRTAADAQLSILATDIQRRQQAADCVTRRLDELMGALTSNQPFRLAMPVGAPTLRLPPLSAVSALPADQMVRHAGAQTYSLYGDLLVGAQTFSEFSRREQESWITLRTLEIGQQPLTADRRLALIEAAYGARDLNGRLLRLGDYLLDKIEALGIDTNASEPERDSNEAICRPGIVRRG